MNKHRRIETRTDSNDKSSQHSSEPSTASAPNVEQCAAGRHKWNGTCQCQACGISDPNCSDFFHAWDGTKCRRCGAEKGAWIPFSSNPPRGENESEIDYCYRLNAEVLGVPLHEERTCPDGVGRYRTYERGSIHCHPATAAHETHGAIREVWARESWEKGWLGYPVTDEQELNIMELYPISDDGDTFYPNVGRISYFQNGAIYWLRDSDQCGLRQRPKGDSHNYARNWLEPERPWWKKNFGQ